MRSPAMVPACLDEETVLAFVGGSWPRLRRAEIEQHLGHCSACTATVAGAARYLSGDRPDATESATDEAILGNRFKLGAQLGGGATGWIRRGICTRSGQQVAIKGLRAECSTAAPAMRNEVRLLQRLSHPGIVPLLGHSQEQERPWLAMPLLPGPTLFDQLQTGQPVHWAETATLLRRIVEALAHVHTRGIVHRDLSPRNIMFDGQGQPILIDFGFASECQWDEGRELVGTLIGAGTVLYIPPEQLRGGAVDQRADLYSLGCIIYQLVTGHPPFRGDRAALIAQHLSVQAPRMSTLVDAVPSELDELVARLLQKEPVRRVAYAADLLPTLARLGGRGWPEQPREVLPSYLYPAQLRGRNRIADELDEKLRGLQTGVGGSVLLVGESGIGKTRLVSALSRNARRADLAVVSCSGDPRARHAGRDGLAAPVLSALRPLLRACADQLMERDDDELDLLLLRHGNSLRGHEPSLDALLEPSLEHVPLDPDAARSQLLRALSELTSAFCRHRPLLLIVDDLQWIDELSAAFFASLAQGLVQSLPVLAVGVSRPDDAHSERWREMVGRGFQQVELPRLDPGSVNSIVRDMLGDDHVPEAVLEWVWRDSGGNPFFISELLRAAVTTSWLSRKEQGNWSFSTAGWLRLQSITVAPLATTVLSLVQRRLVGLSADALTMLEQAAVFGRAFPASLLSSASPLGDGMSAPRSQLDELLERRLLQLSDDQLYAFTHDKLREAVYALMPTPRRLTLHRAYAEYLERHSERDSTEDLAFHFEHGGCPARALPYLVSAAERALRSGAHQAAAALFRRACELAEREQLAPSPRQLAGWKRKQGEAAFGHGDMTGCIESSRKVFGLLRAELLRALPRWLVGRLPAAVEPVTELSIAAGHLAEALYFRGDLLPMVGVVLLGVVLAEQAGDTRRELEARARLGYVAGLCGLHMVSQASFQRVERLATLGDDSPLARPKARFDPRSNGIGQYLTAFYQLGMARWSEVEQRGGHAMAMLASVGAVQEREVAQTIVGHALFYQGRNDEALASYDDLLLSARRRANRQHEAWALFLAARSLVEQRRLSEAHTRLLEARSLLEPLEDVYGRAICAGLLAKVSGELRRADAQEHFTAAERALRKLLPLAPCLDAYEGLAAAALELLQTSGSRAAQVAALRGATRRLALFATIFPIGQPAAARYRAELALLAGRPERARVGFRRAAQRARELDMPIESGRAELRLAWLANRDAVESPHVAQRTGGHKAWEQSVR